jgi:hypothetical protein
MRRFILILFTIKLFLPTDLFSSSSIKGNDYYIQKSDTHFFPSIRVINASKIFEIITLSIDGSYDTIKDFISKDINQLSMNGDIYKYLPYKDKDIIKKAFFSQTSFGAVNLYSKGFPCEDGIIDWRYIQIENGDLIETNKKNLKNILKPFFSKFPELSKYVTYDFEWDNIYKASCLYNTIVNDSQKNLHSNYFINSYGDTTKCIYIVPEFSFETGILYDLTYKVTREGEEIKIEGRNACEAIKEFLYKGTIYQYIPKDPDGSSSRYYKHFKRKITGTVSVFHDFGIYNLYKDGKFYGTNYNREQIGNFYKISATINPKSVNHLFNCSSLQKVFPFELEIMKIEDFEDMVKLYNVLCK